MPKTDRAALELLLENKKEYLQHLYQLLTEPMYAEIQTLYQVAQKQSAADKLLEGFQDLLTKIPHWNADQVLALKERVYLRMNCDYFQELVKATFMVYMKLHLATLADPPTHLKVKVPGMETYIHRVLVAVARLLWKKPYILYHHVRTLEKQKNLLQCEAMIHKAIGQTIQGSLPLNEIFRFVSQETRVHPAATTEDSPDSTGGGASGESDASGASQSSDASDASEASEEESSGEEQSETEEDASGEEQSDASGEQSEEEEEASGEEQSETETEQEEIIQPAPVLSPNEPVVARTESDDSGYKSDNESDASARANDADAPAQPKEDDFNLIKPIEIQEKDTKRRPHRPQVRPVVSKLNASRPSNAFF